MADDNNNVVVVDENEKDNNDIEVSMETDPDLEKNIFAYRPHLYLVEGCLA